MIFKYSVAIGGKLHKFSHVEKAILLNTVQAFLKKNNINYSEKDLSQTIDRQSQLVQKGPKKGVSFATAMSGAKALLRYTKGDSASAQEVTRRANICLHGGVNGSPCPHLSKVNNCMGCGASGRIAQATNAIRAMKGTEIAIPSEVKAQYCGVCDCSIPLMIVTRYKDFYTEDPQKNLQRPDICWLKTTSTNFTHE